MNLTHYSARFIFLFSACLLIIVSVAAGANDSLTVQAVRTDKPPKIDGLLTDPAWKTAVPVDAFTQKDPEEGVPPTQKSEVRVLYDDLYLYVGARLYDTAPDSVVGCLVRRDYGIDSDGFWVDLDTYHDHQNAYYFALDPTGSYYDGTLYNDNWEDNTWDGVWLGKTSRDSLGWCAEFKIPFTQLRFQKQDSMVWGINFWRWLTRRHETSYLTYTPKNESGFVSRFAHLTGIKGIRTPRYVELLPYARGKTRFRQTDSRDPFNNDAEFDATAGLDAKVGLGTNLVLDATVNPDFGQVEVDPAVVNLTDVETYFEERRPFFVEGSRYFNFGIGGSSSYNSFNWSDPSFFYSRRIGRAPSGPIPYTEFADVPDGTRILGAGKITGTLGRNWNVGSIQAVTARETAELDTTGGRMKLEIEPATYYSVNRVIKEFDGGRKGLGGMVTATHRMFKDDALKNQMNSNAFTGGIDGWTFLDKKNIYVVSGWAGVSHTQGNEVRMLRLQKSSVHYFQRPDASQVSLDPNATSLTGFAGRVVLNKERGNWMLHSMVGAIDPGFETNDLGYMSRSDVLYGHTDWGYRWTKPNSWRQSAQLRGAVSGNYDFGGKMTNFMVRAYSTMTLPNFSNVTAKLFTYPLETYNNTRTRGGPRTKNLPSWTGFLSYNSDTRKPIEVYTEATYARVAGDDWSLNPYLSIRFKPAPNLNLSIGPTASLSQDVVQWVGAFNDPDATATYGKRYVFSSLKYTELGAAIRANWTFTPQLSFLMYVQPLFSSGDYSHYKQLAKSGSYDFDEFPESDVDLTENIYTIDPDGSGPANPIQFYNPDFSMNSLRGNFVLKWEYLPGSSLYFVWTHGRQVYDENGEFDLEHATDRLIETNPDDIFMLKATYWLSM